MKRETRDKLKLVATTLLLLALTAPASWGQELRILGPPTPDSATDHADLQVGARDQLHTNQPGALPVRWRSSNTRVATVSSTGLLTARAAGYATIRAVVGADTLTLRACVSRQATDTVARFDSAHRATGDTARAMAGGVRVVLPLPVAPAGTFQQATAYVQLRARLLSWGSCLHWSMEPLLTGLGGSITRTGLMTVALDNRNFPLATVGPTIPSSVAPLTPGTRFGLALMGWVVAAR